MPKIILGKIFFIGLKKGAGCVMTKASKNNWHVICFFRLSMMMEFMI